MKTYYLKVKGTRVIVPVEVYKAYHKINRRLRYLRDKDNKHGLLYYDALDYGDIRAVETLSDPTVVVEDSVITKILCEHVRECLFLLTENERHLIYLLYYEGRSEVAISKALGIPRRTLRTRKMAVLNKLKEILLNS